MSTEHPNFLLRHLAAQLRDRVPLAQALLQLERHAPDGVRQVAGRLRPHADQPHALAGALRQELGPQAGPLPELIDDAIVDGGRLEPVIVEQAAHLAVLEDLGAVLDEHRRGLLFIGAATLGIALVCALILASYVLPSFQAFFERFAADLPELTAQVLAYWPVALPALLAGAAALLLGAWLLLLHADRRVRQGRPLSPQLPLVDQLARCQRRLAALHRLRVLLAAGVAAERLLAKPDPALPTPAHERLSAAAALGTLPAELEAQLREARHAARAAAAALGQRTLTATQVLLGLVVGLLVVAVYLPIFKLGAVV